MLPHDATGLKDRSWIDALQTCGELQEIGWGLPSATTPDIFPEIAKVLVNPESKFYLGHLVIIIISIRIYHCHFYLGGGYDGLHWNWDDGSEWRYNDLSKVWANGEPQKYKGGGLIGSRKQ